jgi:hypothetical protein
MKKEDYGVLIVIFLAILGALIILITEIHEDSASIAQALLTFALVMITYIYVKRTTEIAKATKEQAEASIRMADEMREQRYNSAMPIIDIQEDKNQRSLLHRGASASLGHLPQYIQCRLINIGLGPAIDLCSFIYSSNKRWKYSFGTLSNGAETDSENLFLEKEGDHTYLVAYYRDIYDRNFKSIRKVTLDEKLNNIEIGQLQTRKIIKGKND